MKLSLLVGLLFFQAFQCFGMDTMTMEIELGEPTFVLPQFTGPYMEREATIAPEEYEMAENLKSLLDNKNRAEVLEQLEEYYNLELSPAMVMLKAQVYFSLKMFDEAEQTYLEVLARKPQLVRAHADLGQLYLVMEDTVKARKYLAKAVALGENDAVIHGQLAYLNLTNHGAFSAISEYQQAMALEPENAQWQQGLLSALSQARMYEAANALVGEMLVKQPKNKSLWLAQAAIALEVGEKKRALLSLEMAISLGEKSSNNLKTAAKLHLQLQSYSRAYELIARNVSESDLDMKTIGEYLSWLEVVGMLDESHALLASLRSRLSEFSLTDQSNYFLHKANLARREGHPNKALDDYQKALERDPTNGDALLKMARIKAEHQQYVDAELYYSRARAIDGKEKEAMLGLSQMFIDMKDYESALVLLKNTVAKYPELTDVQENIEIISRIIKSQTSTVL